jgi:hypothetical protein
MNRLLSINLLKLCFKFSAFSHFRLRKSNETVMYFMKIMNSFDFPEEVTDDNFKELVERAEEIQEKLFRKRYLLYIVGFMLIPSAVIGLAIISLMLMLATDGYFNFLIVWFGVIWAPAMFLILLLVVLACFWIPLTVFIILSVSWLMHKYLDFPRHEEAIFSECFIIANDLREDKRLEAKKEVRQLLPFFTSYVRNLMFNPKRKAYSPELDVLRSGKTEIERMLLFSKEDTSRMFMRVGLAFVRNDDPEAFESLRELTAKVKEYGEPKGRLHKLLGHIERYPVSLPWLVGLVIPLTTLALLIYYLLSGQQITLPA